MRKTFTIVLACIWCGLIAPTFIVAAPATMLWYDRPARQWTEALPVGNGRLGAMVFGDPQHERLQLNTVWGGGPYDPSSPTAFDAYAKARELIFAPRGKNKEAADVILAQGMGRPMRQAPYRTIGSLLLDSRCRARRRDGLLP